MMTDVTVEQIVTTSNTVKTEGKWEFATCKLVTFAVR